jgi:PAP2 superfamily
MAATSMGFVYLVLMMCSRVYLGAHSWNQVLFGATLGTGLAVIGHYNIKYWFYGLWDRSLGENRYHVQWKEAFLMVFFVAPFILASHALLVVRLDHLPTFLQNFRDMQDWQTRMSIAGCSDL